MPTIDRFSLLEEGKFGVQFAGLIRALFYNKYSDNCCRDISKLTDSKRFTKSAIYIQTLVYHRNFYLCISCFLYRHRDHI